MTERTWPYGTTLSVKVIGATEQVLSVVADTVFDGFFLINHGVNPLPEINSRGTITFTKGGPTGGYWEFELAQEGATQ